jgi:hypothetical protein
MLNSIGTKIDEKRRKKTKIDENKIKKKLKKTRKDEKGRNRKYLVG